MNLNNNLLLRHFLTQSIFPSTDKEMYVAYLILNKRWSDVALWSMGGYHADAIVNYKERLLLDDRGLRKWEGDFDWSKCSILKIYEDKPTTVELVTTWMKAVGESEWDMQRFIKEVCSD